MFLQRERERREREREKEKAIELISKKERPGLLSNP
jgi:hypothetical protein